MAFSSLFRGLLLLSSFLIALSEASPVKRQSDQCQHTQVLVLGGGVAGVTAAQTLSNNAVTDFLIVEYNGDLGGRVAHTTFGTSPDGTPYIVELGANWVQGLQTDDGPVNPIWTLAQKYNVTNTYSNYSMIQSFNETGAVDYLDVLEELDEAYTQYEIDAGYTISDNLQDTSVRSGLSLAGWKPGNDPQKQAAEWWYFDWEVWSRDVRSRLEH